MTPPTLSRLLTSGLLLLLLATATIAGSRTAHAHTTVAGPIISDTTWTPANSPYLVTASVEVWEGVTLRIEPGVTVRFAANTRLQVNGQLIVRGTAQQPVVFTSAASQPAKGDWGDIEFTTTAQPSVVDASGAYVSGSVLQHCVVEYGGRGVNAAIVATSLLIDNCRVRHHASRGLWLGGAADQLSWVTNSAIEDSQVLNQSRGGGGILAWYAVIRGNRVTGNVGLNTGGGIDAEHSIIEGNVIEHNESLSYALGGGVYAVASDIRDNVIRGNTGGRGGGIYAVGGSIIEDNHIEDNHASGGQGGGVWAGDGVVVLENEIAGNTVQGLEAQGGGVFGYDYTHRPGPRVDVRGNLIMFNTASGGRAAQGGGVFGISRTITGNTISYNTVQSLSGNAHGGGLMAHINTAVISNTIVANQAISRGWAGGAGAYLWLAHEFEHNTVVGNTGPADSKSGGVEIDGGSEVHFNTLFGNEPYDVTIISSHEISGTHNFWGAADTASILDRIHDWYDDSRRGKFLFIPYESTPDPEAPLPPPAGVRVIDPSPVDGQITLAWDALPSQITGWGYKVYYDSDGPLPPFNGVGLLPGPSPLNVGNQTTVTLSGLNPFRSYWFVVTAYDNQGRESWYSPQATIAARISAFLPAVVDR